MAQNLQELGTASVVGVALVYLLGWVHTAAYYDQVGIGMIVMEIPKEYFLIWGYFTVCNLLNNWWFLLAVPLIPLSIPAWPIACRTTIQPLAPLLLWGSLLMLSLLAIGQASDQGEQLMRKDIATGFPKFHPVKLTLLQQQGEIPDSSGKLADGCYRLLVQDKNRVWLVRSIKDQHPALPVTSVPVSQIRDMTILPRNSMACE